eukprot:666826-Alexandrium_andersonii.AAC.1
MCIRDRLCCPEARRDSCDDDDAINREIERIIQNDPSMRRVGPAPEPAAPFCEPQLCEIDPAF